MPDIRESDVRQLVREAVDRALGAEESIAVPPQGPAPAAGRRRVAIGADQGGRYLLAVNADNVVVQRRVELGQTFGEMRQVESGLEPDERVIVAGILEAVPGQKVDPQLRAPGSAATALPPPVGSASR